MFLQPAYQNPATRRVTVKDVTLPRMYFEPIYRVLLYPTDLYEDPEVIRKVCTQVPPVSAIEAQRAVRNANTMGVGIVITCHLYDAKQYVSNLKQADLYANMEEA